MSNRRQTCARQIPQGSWSDSRPGRGGCPVDCLTEETIAATRMLSIPEARKFTMTVDYMRAL